MSGFNASNVSPANSLKLSKLATNVDGDLELVGCSLVVPDGESVKPATNDGATLGVAGKRFSTVKTAKTEPA